MVLHFGHLYHGMRGIVTHRISSFEQSFCAGMFTKGPGNIARRSVESAPFWIPPILMGFVIMYLLNARHHQLQRKNPDDYKDDE